MCSASTGSLTGRQEPVNRKQQQWGDDADLLCTKGKKLAAREGPQPRRSRRGSVLQKSQHS
jgi:hypothetical protein